MNKGNIVLSLILLGATIFGGIGLVYQNKVQQEHIAILQNDTQITRDLLNEEVRLGAFRPSGYTGKLLTRLVEGGSESTFNTTPGTAPDGTSLTTAKIGDFIVLTINPGAANEEKISASAVSVSGTTATWTIINRGLSYTENAAVTANKEQHAIGETVIISNDDHFTSEQYVTLDSAQTFTGQKTFASTSLPQVATNTTYAQLVANGTNTLATLDYVNETATSGASNGSETVKGLWEGATALESASSTILGSTGAGLALQAQYATDTRNSATAGSKVLMTRQDGYLQQAFLDLATQAWSFAASSAYKLTLNGLAYVFPSTRSASSTVLAEDGSGNLSFVARPLLLYHNTQINTTTTAGATTTLATYVLPANTLGTASKSLRISGMWTSLGGSNKCFADIEFGNGSASSTLGFIDDNTNGGIQMLKTTIYATSSTALAAFTEGTSATAGNIAITETYRQVMTTAYNPASTLYVAFSSKSIAGDTCKFIGGTVELLSI